MTLPIERARTRRPITWVTLVGVLLLPVILGGILVAALYNPVERLDSMTAAIVNEDEPVTIDDQLIPLGRQLTAGLVEGSDEASSNLDWAITNADAAAEGLADGTYVAIVTIPANFSSAATSAGQTLSGSGGTPEQATIDVLTAPDALIVDDAITAQVTTAAASVMGTALSSTTLENVFIGYSTLGDKLAEAADGAEALASGARGAADGAAQLPGGATQLAGGATGLSSGAARLGEGLGTIADKTREAGSGASRLADGIRAGAGDLERTGVVPQELTDLAAGSAASSASAAGQIGGVATSLGTLAATCVAEGGSAMFCADLQAAAGDAGAAAQTAGAAATQAAYTSGGLDQLAAQLPAELAKRLRTIAANVDKLATGMGQLAGGIDESASGADQLASGAAELAGGIGTYGAGTQELADGLVELATGTETLADGIGRAAASVPVLDETEAQNLAEVIADPVAAEGVGTNIFGASAIPLLAVLALWVGGLGAFIALQAVSRDAFASRAPSVAIALRGLTPAAALGAAQGLLVAGVVQVAASYDWGTWSLFAIVCMIAGVAFAAVNQALVAVFGGAGRWIGAVIAVLSVATGIVSTVPGALAGVAALMPTAPAYNAMVGVLTAADGAAAGVVGMLVWSGIALVATTLAVARKRTTSARALLAATA